MKGDFTRFTFDGSKRYSSVRMQQGRVLIDSDWNEQLDIDAYRDTIEAKDVIGLNGVPQSDKDSFKVSVSDNTIHITKGRCYVNGILCENEENIDYTKQPDLPEAQLPKEEGKYLAYLDVWQRHITAIEDPSIREQALGGADTTTRTKTIWQCKLLKVAENGENQGGYQTTQFAEWDGLLKSSEKKGKLHVQTRQEPEANYENALYRVEIHKSGKLGEATFKWSRNNGAIAAEIKDINVNKIIIESNFQADFAAGQWVEISDERNILCGKPGVFVELTEVKGSELSIKESPESNQFTFDKNFKATVRRWDSALLTLKEQTEYIHLENGLEVKFENGIYTSGDYWLIPTRSGETIAWDNAQSPHGIDHHYGLLATLRFDGQTWKDVVDCREIFAPLTEATKRISNIENGSLTLLEIEDKNSEKKTLKVEGKLQLESGIAVSQFSKDGTLKSNSDDIVPTEQAVKKYVDNKWEETFKNQIQFKSQFEGCEEEKLKTVVTIKACDLGYSIVPLYLMPKEEIKVKLEGEKKFFHAKLMYLDKEGEGFRTSREIVPEGSQEIDVTEQMEDKLKKFLKEHPVEIKATFKADTKDFIFTIDRATIKPGENNGAAENLEPILVVEPDKIDSWKIKQQKLKVILIFRHTGPNKTNEPKETRPELTLTLTLTPDEQDKAHTEEIEKVINDFIKLSSSWEKIKDLWQKNKKHIAEDTERIVRNYLISPTISYCWKEEKEGAILNVTKNHVAYKLKKEEILGKAIFLYVTYS
jgi:hypothetical protein